MFGEFVKKRRIGLGIGLREFCRRIGEDPSNWSKVERKVLAPPKNQERLETIANVLEIEKGSDGWDTLNDYANIDSGIIPEYIKSDKEVLKWLPAFFRTVGNVKPSKEELDELIESLKGG